MRATATAAGLNAAHPPTRLDAVVALILGELHPRPDYANVDLPFSPEHHVTVMVYPNAVGVGSGRCACGQATREDPTSPIPVQLVTYPLLAQWLAAHFRLIGDLDVWAEHLETAAMVRALANGSSGEPGLFG